MSFGEQVTIAGTDYPGIFDDWSLSDGGGPKVRLRSEDVDATGLQNGDTITIRLRAFTVDRILRNGTGTAMVLLWKDGERR